MIIKVTQDLKDKNKLFKNIEVGSFYIGNLPNKFFGSENIIGGYAGRTDLHKTDGWYELVTPEVLETEKLGERYFDEENEVYTYYVVQKTPEDLEAEAENQKEIKRYEIKQKYLDAIAEDQITTNLNDALEYYKEWEPNRAYTVKEGVIYKGKPFRNTVEGNTNEPDKGGWIEIK